MGGGRWVGGWGLVCAHVMHGRGNMITDARGSAGTEHVGFPLIGQTLLLLSAKRNVRGWGGSHEGWVTSSLLQSACEADLRLMAVSN